jgi:rod shape-determining protein MreC
VFTFNSHRAVSLVAIILGIILLASIIPALRSPILYLFKFPLQLLTSAGREIKGFIFYHENYIENGALKRRVDFLENKLNQEREVFLENERLKQLLSFKDEIPYKVITARVIGRDPSNWASAIIINKGKRNGIRKSYVSVTFLGLIGRVVEEHETTSKVLLINDPNMCISALVQRSRQEGLVCGSLGGLLVMKYLPKDCDIKVDDTVVTSGLTDNYPKGLLIGTVAEVGTEFSGMSSYAVIKPAVNLSALEEAFIIIP